MPKPKPISLAPLKFKEAVAVLLKVKPPKAKKKERPKLIGDIAKKQGRSNLNTK